MGTLTVPRMAGASNIMVGWICPGDVTNSFASALVDTILGDTSNRIKAKVSLQSSPRIAQARTEMVDAFLNHSDCEWLLMIDADMMWEYEHFDKVCKAADKERRPIVGGLCFAGGRNHHTEKLNIYPTLYRMWTAEDGELDSQIMYDYPKNKIIEVSATGAAFLLVHRRVFVGMLNALGKGNPFPWFMETIMREKPLGEDVTFCVRATSLGYPIHVHTGATIRHEKRFQLTEELYDDNPR